MPVVTNDADEAWTPPPDVALSVLATRSGSLGPISIPSVPTVILLFRASDKLPSWCRGCLRLAAAMGRLLLHYVPDMFRAARDVRLEAETATVDELVTASERGGEESGTGADTQQDCPVETIVLLTILPSMDIMDPPLSRPLQRIYGGCISLCSASQS